MPAWRLWPPVRGCMASLAASCLLRTGSRAPTLTGSRRTAPMSTWWVWGKERVGGGGGLLQPGPTPTPAQPCPSCVVNQALPTLKEKLLDGMEGRTEYGECLDIRALL